MKRLMALIAVFTLLGAVLSADEDSHRFPMDLHDLGLTSAQHKAAESAMREYQQAYRIHHHQREAVQKELNALFLNPHFDSKRFQKKSLETERTSVEIQARLFERLHGVLTPEQRGRFIRHMREWDIE